MIEKNSADIAPPKKNIRVVAAIIWNNEQTKILLSQRRATQDFSGLWEFPGGKVEPDESDDAAICRELFEELGITVKSYQQELTFSHEYPEKKIDFIIYSVTEFTGLPTGKEYQIIQWFTRDEVKSLHFPEANKIILEHL